MSLRDRIRDYIYDCTKDGFGAGWTLSAEEAGGLIAMARGRDSDAAATAAPCGDMAVPKDQQARADKHRPKGVA